MKILFVFLSIHLAIVSFSQSPAKRAINYDSLLKEKSKALLGKPFPRYFATNEKVSISNDSLLGKVVLVNFWFEACPPCIAEFEGFNELSETLKQREDFEFISFTHENAETIKRIKEKYKLKFQIFPLSKKESSNLNQANGYPTTYVLDREGKIKYFITGGSTDPKKATEFIMSVLLQEIQKEL